TADWLPRPMANPLSANRIPSAAESTMLMAGRWGGPAGSCLAAGRLSRAWGGSSTAINPGSLHRRIAPGPGPGQPAIIGCSATSGNAMVEARRGVHTSRTIAIREHTESAPPGLGRPAGDGHGDAIDVALKPIDGSTLVAKGLPNAASVIATAERGSLVRAPVGL